MKTLLLLIALMLSACGSAPGGSQGETAATTTAPVAAPPAAPAPVGPATHTYRMEVYGANPDFVFAPAIIGTNANETSPGPQTITLGVTKVYTLVDTQGEFQITGSSASNVNFFVTVTVFVDGTQMANWNITPGISEGYGPI